MKKQYYLKPQNDVIDDVLFTAPLCASPEEGFVIDDKFEDDGTF